jgi:hypothetical protein
MHDTCSYLSPLVSPLRRRTHPVPASSSSDLTVVVFEEAAEPFMTTNRIGVPLALMGRRQEDHIAFALVRALLVKMGHLLCERMPEGALPKQDES